LTTINEIFIWCWLSPIPWADENNAAGNGFLFSR